VDYALKYEAARKDRGTQHQAVFLPLELLVDRASGVSCLSVSLSGTGSLPIYITRKASLYRVAKVIFRWWVIPATISKVFTQAEFESRFSRFLGIATVDGEQFWQVSADSIPALGEAIAGEQLDNTFRDLYLHGYLSQQ
jgi:hypothetical protein